MIEKRRATRIGKYLSLVLRHRPRAADVTLDAEGWASIEELIAGAERRGFAFTRAELDEVVETNEKQRFAVSPDGTRIRANQGHSVEVDLGLAPETPPPVLYHGTVERSVASILAEGIKKGRRRHVHLSADVETAGRVGERRGSPVILEIAAQEMQAAGFAFYRSANGVWLTDAVPPQYISRRES